jgi:hypothetical protein
MADTIRNLASLQALFADNNSEEISPQDLRDFLVSAIKLPGITQTAPANFTVTSTAIERTICSQTFALSLGGTAEIWFKGHIQCPITTSVSSINDTQKLYINNTLKDTSRVMVALPTTTALNQMYGFTLMGIATLAAGTTHSITVTDTVNATGPSMCIYLNLMYRLTDIGA